MVVVLQRVHKIKPNVLGGIGEDHRMLIIMPIQRLVNWKRNKRKKVKIYYKIFITIIITILFPLTLENDQNAVATQTTRPNSPDISDRTLSKTDSTMNAENTSAIMDNMEDLSQASSKSESTDNKNKMERYKKSLRLSSESIVSYKIKIIEFTFN